MFVTLAHELGHIFCGHMGGCEAGSSKVESGWPSRKGLGNDEREVEGEAVAYLVSARAGLKPASAEYLRAYALSADLTRIDMNVVVRAAARIERLAGMSHGMVRFAD
ncbi:hypothetical protein BHAOGJBA_1652 [Methylobacterium hispanicum]|uniref:IrrE N-terminal-like domain-containing protein n=2 Tax=Methylobacteriaceae TaxID=119045 RepID=A0AAV4ZJQ3_9HYPH|nr:hypothetical protein BHAOGJBA_1652 [Methylobacterium hispanicum]